MILKLVAKNLLVLLLKKYIYENINENVKDTAELNSLERTTESSVEEKLATL